MEGIFNKFSTVLQSAVDALAPPVQLLDDFTYHWKMLMKFYLNQNAITKTSIENTNIPAHLNQLLKLILEEEGGMQENGATGPCLEYFLQHHLLDLLATLACTDCPPGMKQHTFSFVRKLIIQTKQPILPHVAIYVPIQRLIGLCNGSNASPTEQIEIHFLCTLCGLVCKDPHLMNVFNSNSVVKSIQELDQINSDRNELPEIDGLTPIGGEIKPSTSTKGASQGDEASPLNKETTSSDKSQMCNEVNKFPLLDALLSYLLSADSRVMVKACEGLMVLASLPSDDLARLVAEQSNMCVALSSRLHSTFISIPVDVDPNDLDDMQVKWGLDSPIWSDESMFYGCRSAAVFFSWLDYCDQLVRESHPILGTALAKSIHDLFFDNVLAIKLTSSETPSNLVLVTALISKCLKQSSAPALLTAFIYWLIGDNVEPEIPGVVTCKIHHTLLENCFHIQDEVTLETLRLFEVLMEKPHEHVLQCLVLTYLEDRSYYDTVATDAIASWSDEEDERERNRENTQLDFSPGSSPISRTLAPSNIHKIINSFLFLIPQHLHSSMNPEESGYQQYVQDADSQYRTCIARCSNNAWPVEATFPETNFSDDSGSLDSRPEADHRKSFYEGPFLHMLFSRILRLPYQPYEINLQLTGLVSRLAMLPHPYLHEFILNPMLPVADGTITLFMTLQVVASELATQIPTVENFKEILQATRYKLLGDGSYSPEEGSNCLFESLIVLEEFCKELAAIAFVKYHHSS